MLGLALPLKGVFRPSGAVDPFFSNVKFLSGFEGTNGSTIVVDEATAKVVTANGNAQISTAQAKFGLSSSLFDGSGDFISVADPSGDFDFGSGDMGISCWFRLLSTASEHGFFEITDGTTPVVQVGQLFGTMYFRWWNAANQSRDTTFSFADRVANQWYHLHVEKNAGRSRFFVDGVFRAGLNNSDAIRTVSGAALRIGRWDNFFYNGYFDEFRVDKGVARQGSDANFTVPAAAYPRA
jgi:hypothetical protein